jgi:glycosyltransferase involved in cell wall biosynthesis
VKTLVAVIAYNEERNIRAALEDLAAHNGGFDVVVVDNGSLDGTADVCRRLGVRVISHCINSGGSMGTVSTYFRYACRHGYEALCQFDSDGQHIAAELPKILDPVRSGEADYVIGSRFITKEGFQSTAVRRIGIRLFSAIDSAVIGQPVTDVTSGFRAYSRRVIEFFGRAYRHELHDTNQLLLLSHFAGARVREVPVTMRERSSGQSEYDVLTAMAFPLKGLVNIAGALLQRRLITDGREPWA